MSDPLSLRRDLPVIFYPADCGLANRLRALVGYQALSTFLDVPFRLCWARYPACDAEFSELFDSPHLVLMPEKETRRLIDSQQATALREPQWFSSIWERYLKGEVPWSVFKERSLCNLNALQPRAEISRAVDRFAKDHGLDNAWGVHIRATDNIDTYRRFAEVCPSFEIANVSSIAGFEEVVAAKLKCGHGRRVFLATDNAKVEARFIRQFGRRVVTYPKKYKGRFRIRLAWKLLPLRRDFQRTSSVGEALIELLLLGRCSSIVGTYYSSFGQLAAVWSGKPYWEVRGARAEPNAFVDRLYARDSMSNAERRPEPS